MFDPSRYTRSVRRPAARSIRVSVFEIDVDDTSPETVALRDEHGSRSFVTSDGGRSWDRVDPRHHRSSTTPPIP
ncbi:MAG: hypothetical protein U0269_02200 [Polyangiales bacterium]